MPLYGPVKWQPRFNALDELIFTVLTQHTSDRNAERAFEKLQQLGDWEAIADTEAVVVTDTIRTGGLANQKGKRIKEILRRIRSECGTMSLDWLGDKPWEEARDWLMKLPGVGIKSASVVMAFTFGAPAMPVDTHIHRVSRRLGLIAENDSAEDSHYILENLVPEAERFVFHVLIITHGRQLCKARKPLCQECPLSDECISSSAKPHEAG